MTTSATSTTPLPRRTVPPPPILQIMELRVTMEFAAGLTALPWLRLAPAGDGHPVLVLPGLVASDLSTHLLRTFLGQRGYDVHGWGLGRNYGPKAGVEEAMLETVDRLHAQHGRKVSLIGHSLGGSFARLLATQRPDAIRSVITLGSPIAGNPRSNNAWRLYEFTSGKTSGDPELWEHVWQMPPVPTTSIYSRTDGIVAWPCSLQAETDRTDNIEVISSHLGMIVTPAALYAVAERLAQPEGQWKPFERSGWRAAVFPQAAARVGA